MHELSLCLLNLILLLSSLSCLEQRCHSSPVWLLLHEGYLSMISLIAVCTLAHFSFILLLLWVLLGTLGLLLRLWLVSLFLRWIFIFFLDFESTLESPATKFWSLEGLMVPIITSLSYSSVRDSMNSARLGIFHTWAVNLVEWKVKKTLNSQGQASRVCP